MERKRKRWLGTGVAAVLAAVWAMGCTPVEPPVWLVVCEGTCVLRVEYGDGQAASEIRIAASRPVFSSRKREVVRMVLSDGAGTEICRAEGEAFAERYRQAPRRGGGDYALRLSAEGAEWMTRDAFVREAEALRERQRAEREEQEARKDWLTRELDSRARSGGGGRF